MTFPKKKVSDSFLVQHSPFDVWNESCG